MVDAVDLFCGVGAMSYGLKQSGINIVLGVDNDKECQYPYETNNQNQFLSEDVKNINGKNLRKYCSTDSLRLLVGCAPCQPFTLNAHVKKLSKHSKYSLFSEFARIVSEFEPDFVISENVAGIINDNMFQESVQLIKDNGYYICCQVVGCADFGIPQKRRRMILLGSKLGQIDGLSATHNDTGDYNLDRYVTLRDTIGFLNDVETNADNKMHKCINLSDINIKRILQSKPGRTWLDWDKHLWRERHKNGKKDFLNPYSRLEWDTICSTITTEFFNYGSGRFGHPEKNRALSLLEGALIQTFPIDYRFTKKESVPINEVARHIGNAVPVKLAKHIGSHLLDHIDYYNRNKEMTCL